MPIRKKIADLLFIFGTLPLTTVKKNKIRIHKIKQYLFTAAKLKSNNTDALSIEINSVNLVCFLDIY
jgi:hypothetical protein